MEFTVQASNEFPNVDVGTYTATLEKIQEMPPTQANPTWGPSLLWQFRITTPGQWFGKDVAAFTPAVPKENNNLGKLLRQMIGRKLQPNEKVDAGAMIGQPFSIVVDLNPSGQKTRVVSAHKTSQAPLASMIQSATKAAPSAPPRPPASQAAPTPPKPARAVVTKEDLSGANLDLTAFFSLDGAPSFEATIGSVRQKVTQGLLDPQELQAYCPATTEWIPWVTIDLPF